MNLGELEIIFRREMGDTVAPYLWGSAEVPEFATDAVMEAVRRGFQIVDSTTTAVCNIAYTSATPVLTLDVRIIAIRTAIVSGQTLPLGRVSVSWMDRAYPGWRSTTATLPTSYINDWGSGKIRLYPQPTASGTVLLSVAREPLLPLTQPTDTPEIPARYHRSLVAWMKYRGYDKDDTEAGNPLQADRAERAFAAEFGERKSARNEKWAAEQSAPMADTLA